MRYGGPTRLRRVVWCRHGRQTMVELKRVSPQTEDAELAMMLLGEEEVWERAREEEAFEEIVARQNLSEWVGRVELSYWAYDTRAARLCGVSRRARPRGKS